MTITVTLYTQLKVPMKRKLSLGSCKIYPFKHAISKSQLGIQNKTRPSPLTIFERKIAQL